MPKQPDLNQILKQAQQMQADLVKAQEEARIVEVEASAGGGMVTVKVNGAGELIDVKIDPAAVDPDDVELLQDMVIAAANEAIRSAQELAERKMQEAAGGLGGLGDIGGLLGGGPGAPR